jgi:hypothetical protein
LGRAKGADLFSKESESMFDLKSVQSAIAEMGFDAWLLYDFRGSNTLALRVLGLDGKGMASRRFFYLIPARGTPQKLVHRIESATLDHLPGDKHVYLRWQELEAGVKQLVTPFKRIAMEYSPRNAIPYVSQVDGGTIELVKGSPHAAAHPVPIERHRHDRGRNCA